MYFLLFLWLFAFTGLLLNHPRWALSRIPNDANPAYERAIETPRGTTNLARRQDIIRQLDLAGELEWPQGSPSPETLDFNLAYPRQATQVHVDLVQNRATVRQIDRSLWSAIKITHTFSGSRFNALLTERDWLLTTIWVVAMDALAVGLLVMVLSSYVMWYRLQRRRALGWVVLTAGVVSCGVFVFGLLP